MGGFMFGTAPGAGGYAPALPDLPPELSPEPRAYSAPGRAATLRPQPRPVPISTASVVDPFGSLDPLSVLPSTVPPAGTPVVHPEDAPIVKAAAIAGETAGRSTHVPTLRENWSFPTGTASVNRGVNLGGDEWAKRHQTSPMPMPGPSAMEVAQDGMVRNGEPVRPHEGYLFSGSGTQADEEGRLRTDDLINARGRQRAEKAQLAELEEDPFAEERAKAGAGIQRDVIRERARGAADIDTAQAKDDAKYASGDTILLIMYQNALGKLEAETKRSPEEKERIKAGLFKKYQKDRLELRKQGLTGGYEKKDFFSDLPTATKSPAQ